MKKTISIHYPQQQRSWQKFHRVLEVLPIVLEARGFKKSTAAELALEADISIGSFYDYFSSKEAVYIAYLDHHLQKALEAVEQTARDDANDTAETLRQLITVGVNFAYEHQAVLKSVITQMPLALQQIGLEKSKAKLEAIGSVFIQREKNWVQKDMRVVMYTLSTIVMGFQARIAMLPEDGPGKAVIVNEITEIIQNYLFER